MHRQIKIVAILMMVEGGIEAVMALFLIIMGPVMMAFMRSAPPPSSGSGAPPPELFGVIYIVMGVVVLVGAVLKIFAGIRNIALKGRVLGFVALGSAILSFMSCYCAPTAIALGVYGLIVYLNDRSAQAFAMGETGMPADQVLAQLDGIPQPGQYPPQYPPQYPQG